MENEKYLKLTTIVNPHGFWKFLLKSELTSLSDFLRSKYLLIYLDL